MLEELINETDRPMFFERAQLHCAVRLGRGALLCNFMCSSPIFFLAAHAMPLIRWNLRTEALEEEELPLPQGVTPAGHTCDLGLSAFADDVAKKIVGRSEKELFEALKHSDEVLDEELARGGWKRNVDKREVVPVGSRHRCWSSTLGRTVHVEWQQSGGTALPKEGGSHCMAVYGQILDGEGTLGHETHHFWLQGPRSCGCGGGNLRVARLGDAGDLFSAVQLHESNAPRTCQDGRKWASSAVANQRLHEHWRIPPVSVEVAVRRFVWLQAMLRDETNHAQPLAAIFGRFLGKDVLEENG